MVNVLWILGFLSVFVWPWYAWIHLPKFRQQQYSIFVHFVVLCTPATFCFSLMLYFQNEQQTMISQDCGRVVDYQTYMTAGNKNKRQPFERVSIQFEGQKYVKHLRMPEELEHREPNTMVCVEFHDRKKIHI